MTYTITCFIFSTTIISAGSHSTELSVSFVSHLAPKASLKNKKLAEVTQKLLTENDKVQNTFNEAVVKREDAKKIHT